MRNKFEEAKSLITVQLGGGNTETSRLVPVLSISDVLKRDGGVRVEYREGTPEYVAYNGSTLIVPDRHTSVREVYEEINKRLQIAQTHLLALGYNHVSSGTSNDGWKPFTPKALKPRNSRLG